MALRYLLDTNICIYIAKRKPLSVLNKFEQLTAGEVGMSTITYGELLHGIQKSSYSKSNLLLLEELTRLISPLPLPIEAGKYYGDIREKLEREGKIIGNNDLWIAAHALTENLILVTNNEKEFLRVPGVKVENWVA